MIAPENDVEGRREGPRAEKTILQSADYAARLGVSLRMMQQALKLKGSLDSGRYPVKGSPLDRPSLRSLAARIAPPTDYVASRYPIPVWYVGDVERFEQGTARL